MSEPVPWTRRRLAAAATLWIVLAAAAGVVGVRVVLDRAAEPTASAAPAGTLTPVLDPTGPGPADGDLAGGAVSPFADDEPAVGRLDPALRRALQRAARAAEADGVAVVVTSGWRSARYQQRLLDQAVERYGSREEAARWVSTPARSEHVTGKAVDIGYTDADSWFEQHGAAYGLCRMYANEMWHFELATTPGGTCPQQFESAATRDAR